MNALGPSHDGHFFIRAQCLFCYGIFIFSRLAIIMVYFSVYRRIETVITYADIREKQAEIQEARQEYIQRLRDMGKKAGQDL
ncbi:Uncharacterised protein [Escherichia coli]|uniref:Uncharacterized protein n=1 Tax=Escherichia coli TaxID=562 RepID=A0A376KVS1_ECOLX|nr:Uncharacterised protein [Escherichia coli]